jgi:hypothetical protein
VLYSLFPVPSLLGYVRHHVLWPPDALGSPQVTRSRHDGTLCEGTMDIIDRESPR